MKLKSKQTEKSKLKIIAEVICLSNQNSCIIIYEFRCHHISVKFRLEKIWCQSFWHFSTFSDQNCAKKLYKIILVGKADGFRFELMILLLELDKHHSFYDWIEFCPYSNDNPKFCLTFDIFASIYIWKIGHFFQYSWYLWTMWSVKFQS